MDRVTAESEAAQALLNAYAASYPNYSRQSQLAQMELGGQNRVTGIYQQLELLTKEQREEIANAIQSTSNPTLPTAPNIMSDLPSSYSEATLSPAYANNLIRNRSTDNYQILPTRSGRIPHLPRLDHDVQTRESELFNNYFDFPSDDDEEEDPDFFPQLEEATGIPDWDELLIPGEYGSSEVEESGTESYRDFLMGLKNVSNLEPLPSSTPDLPMEPVASSSRLPPVVPAPVAPPPSIAPIPKKRARNVASSPRLPSAIPESADPSKQPAAPVSPMIEAPVKRIPVKRIKLTPEESKARRHARSVAAAALKKEQRREKSAGALAARMLELEAENTALKQRVNELEMGSSEIEGKGGSKRASNGQGMPSAQEEESSESDFRLGTEPMEDATTLAVKQKMKQLSESLTQTLQGLNSEQLSNFMKAYQIILAQGSGPQ